MGGAISLLSILMFASLAAMEGSAAADPVEQVLPSGVRVVVLRDRAAPVVAARALWSGGEVREPAGLAGVTRLLAGAWTGGCGRRAAGAVERDLGDGSMIGVAGRDTLALAAEWPRGGWEAGFEILADCVLEPAFAPEAVSVARLQLRALAAERDHSPPWIAHQLLEEALFGPADPDAALERADRGHIRELYRVHYPTSAMTLAVVGDVEPEAVLARARRRFGAAPRARRPEPPAAVKTSAPRERELYRRLSSGETAALAVGFLAVERAHRDRAALEVAAALLPARASLVAGGESGYLALEQTCRPADLPATHDALRAAVDRLRDPGPTEADVRRAATRLAAARDAALARAPNAAALLALYEALGPGADQAARHAARLRAVRAADVRAAAGTYLRLDRAALATASPLLASPEAARRLRTVRKPARAERPARKPARRRGRRR